MKLTKHIQYLYQLPRIPIFFILLICIIGVLAPILANNKALIAYDHHGEIVFPVFMNQNEQIPYEAILRAPIPYGESSIDLQNANAVGPFDKQEVSSNYYRHWLGTDELGRDVLSQLIYACRTSVFIGFLSMFFAAIIGIWIGGTAAYFGDHRLSASILRIVVSLGFLLFFLFAFFFVIPWDIPKLSLSEKWIKALYLIIFFVFIGILLNFLLSFLEKKFNFKKYPLALDLLIGRLIEIIESLPLFFLIIAISALFKPGFWALVFILAFSSWSRIAKYFRAQVFLVKSLSFIESSRALGYSNYRIMYKHIFPNAISSVLVLISFGIAAAILVESTLSFLGFGLGAEQASWGKLLAGARNDFQAWWLAIFPGLAIFFTVLSLNQLGDRLGK